MIISPLFIMLIVPTMLFAFWAQWKVSSTFKRYSEVPTRKGLTGASVAENILRDHGISLSDDPSGELACAVEPTAGELTDHYDPRDRTLRLSESVYGSNSVAALGVAAHEVGHAIQHANLYGPLVLRNIAYPVSNFSSKAAVPLFLVGIVAYAFAGMPQVGLLAVHAAIAFFTVAVFFTVVTLPVEFNASKRALAALSSGGYVTSDELQGAKKVLDAAAMTYVAAAAMALAQLVHWILIAASMGRD